MGKITLENISIFGFHGCMEEEIKVGSLFTIDLEINTDFKKSYISDNLYDTIDYTYLYKIIKEEMLIRSNLIENLANRIIEKIKINIKNIDFIKIKLCKISPPLKGADINKICVIITR